MDKLVDRWPVLASELRAALIDEEPALADTVDGLVVVRRCRCNDDFCQSFFTVQPPDGPWGQGHRNVQLDPPWPGLLVLDVVGDAITYVEIVDRPGPLG